MNAEQVIEEVEQALHDIGHHTSCPLACDFAERGLRAIAQYREGQSHPVTSATEIKVTVLPIDTTPLPGPFCTTCNISIPVSAIGAHAQHGHGIVSIINP